MSQLRCAVLILNFNGCEDTLACLESLSVSGYPECDIIVVDNGSKDSSLARLARWAENKNIPLERERSHVGKTRAAEFSGVPVPCKLILLETGTNIGFAGGNNIGIKYALTEGVEYILLLNNDTVVEPGLVAQLLEVARKENAGIVGSRICCFDRPEHIWFIGGEFRWWNSRMRQKVAGGSEENSPILPTDWVTGCCMLVHRSVFERIGLFDENAFLYREDVDFCERAAEVGIRRVVAAGTTIYHKVSRSAGEDTPFTWYHTTKSRLYFHRKHHSAHSHVAFLALFLFSRVARSLVWLLLGRMDLVRATWCAMFDAYGRRKFGSKRFRSAVDCGGLVPK
ncbi:MAG TPA: glycosyltransferase family 2 protein [Candidatus Polarisedimenticolia bacterium]|nr:glycosyltransferase family 2 protein [Candidatus Polarisedimenticolia bacterium]